MDDRCSLKWNYSCSVTSLDLPEAWGEEGMSGSVGLVVFWSLEFPRKERIMQSKRMREAVLQPGTVPVGGTQQALNVPWYKVLPLSTSAVAGVEPGH